MNRMQLPIAIRTTAAALAVFMTIATLNSLITVAEPQHSELIAQTPRGQEVGESEDSAEHELHRLPPAERHGGPDGPPHRLERCADAEADPATDRAVERKHRGYARAEPCE